MAQEYIHTDDTRGLSGYLGDVVCIASTSSALDAEHTNQIESSPETAETRFWPRR